MSSVQFGEWQARLIDSPGFDGARLYLYKKLDRQHSEFICEDGTIRTLSRDASPDKSYFAHLQQGQLVALAEAFANYGIKTPNDHKVEGLLEAKDQHLQDMRKLIFKEVHETSHA